MFSYSNTRDKDIFYLLRANILDDFFLLEMPEKIVVFLNSLEIDAFREKNKNPKIEAVSSSPFFKEAAAMGDPKNLVGNAALIILRHYQLERAEIEVSSRFPLDLADFLRAKGIKLIIRKPFRPERALKSVKEKNLIKESIQKTYPAYRKIEEMLKDSDTVTSEMVKKEVEKIFLEEDMVSTEGMIISSGYQTALPHHAGSGPIKAGEPIICDLFPVSNTNGYFADITRTYVKGKPSDKLLKMYEAVLKAQKTALGMIKPGMKGSDIHAAVCQSFLEDGFDVGEKGFIHSTGHGLGLDIHEGPSISQMSETILKEGHVLTVEPGLYYPETGGVRLEDVVYVTNDGCENLTDYPKEFLITS